MHLEVFFHIPACFACTVFGCTYFGFQTFSLNHFGAIFGFLPPVLASPWGYFPPFKVTVKYYLKASHPLLNPPFALVSQSLQKTVGHTPGGLGLDTLQAMVGAAAGGRTAAPAPRPGHPRPPHPDAAAKGPAAAGLWLGRRRRAECVPPGAGIQCRPRR